MADIELVIKIDEKYLESIKKRVKDDFIDYEPWVAIANGTPLPKGHGRIVDGDIILIWLIYKGVIDKLKCGEIASVYKEATIIEADTAERSNYDTN